MNLNQKKIVEFALEQEEQYSANQYNGKLDEEYLINITEGNFPILISCPYATNYTKEGESRPAHVFTGTIGTIVREHTNCFLINVVRNFEDDPFELAIYKNVIKNLIEEHNIKYVIDIHGIAHYRPFEIILGTNWGKSISKEKVERIKRILKKNDIIEVKENFAFTANKPDNVTFYCSTEFNIPSLQFSIHKNFREPQYNGKLFMKSIKSLIEIIEYLKK